MEKFRYLVAIMSMMIADEVFAGTRYIYVQAPQSRSLDGVERVVRDMAAIRGIPVSRSLPPNSYHQDLDARLRALETKNNITPRAFGPVGAAIVTDFALSAAADILGALNSHVNSSDQDKAQAILDALIPHIQQAQQASAANAAQNANSAVPGLTKAEAEFILAVKSFVAATENVQKDGEERKKLLEGQKKKIDELIQALKKISP